MSMFEMYMLSVVLSAIPMGFASWFDVKQYCIKVSDVVNIIVFSALPILNVFVALYAIIATLGNRGVSDFVLFGGKE